MGSGAACPPLSRTTSRWPPQNASDLRQKWVDAFNMLPGDPLANGTPTACGTLLRATLLPSGGQNRKSSGIYGQLVTDDATGRSPGQQPKADCDPCLVLSLKAPMGSS